MTQMVEWLGMAGLMLAGAVLVLALFMVLVWQLRFLIRAARKMHEI
jgi:hypothetical protein